MPECCQVWYKGGVKSPLLHLVILYYLYLEAVLL
jgi:hypothetical protein